MSVTQYIGARYVPIFADPEEWNNTRAYEPLTIVVHQGNSYTSKQSVPIGIDILDTRYWALTGNYNAQVEAYRREVAGYSNRIEAIELSQDEINAAISDLQSTFSSFQSDITNALNDEIEARKNALNDEIAARKSSIDDILARFPIETDNIADEAVTKSKLAPEVTKMNSARDMLLDNDTYIDNVNGDDATGEVGNVDKPFKTLDAAFSAADEVGNNFRFFFLRSGEYTLTARVIVGSAIHLFTERANGEVIVNIDTGVEDGGMFIYDTHLACYGTAEARLTINTTA